MNKYRNVKTIVDNIKFENSSWDGSKIIKIKL